MIGRPMTNEQTQPLGEEAALRERAREVVRAGRVPNRRPDRAWGGHGLGVECAICNRPVRRDELEFEIEFARQGDRPGLDTYHLHIRCFAAWEFERDHVAPPPASPSS